MASFIRTCDTCGFDSTDEHRAACAQVPQVRAVYMDSDGRAFTIYQRPTGFRAERRLSSCTLEHRFTDTFNEAEAVITEWARGDVHLVLYRPEGSRRAVLEAIEALEASR